MNWKTATDTMVANGIQIKRQPKCGWLTTKYPVIIPTINKVMM
ncbi:MAG: hypothetical protein ABF247_13390 [Nonlabens sp.]